MAARPMTRLTSSPALYIFTLLLIGIIYVKRHEAPRASEWVHKLKGSQIESVTTTHRIDLAKEPPALGPHPVQALHEEAIKKFEDMVKRQSKTLDDAVAEYKRRYRRNPPPGFDKWYAYAVKHKSAIIDEFDMINEAMEPFWKLSPSTIGQVHQRASSGYALWTFAIHNGHAVIGKENWMGDRIRDTLGDAIADIPNLEILMNPLDEPRILLSQTPPTDEVRWTDRSMEAAYSAVAAPCSHLPRVTPPQSSVDTYKLPFVTSSSVASDICLNPDLANTHGFLIAPTSLLTTDSPVPILSQAALSTFSDILYPSMWYWDHIIADLDSYDPDWADKRNRVYWAGSTTGGWNHNNMASISTSHRHRFVKMTRQIGNGVYNFLTRSSAETSDQGSWTRYQSEEVLAQLYDTKFTRTVQCEEEECARMKMFYQVTSPEDGRIPYKSRFLMDLDGNSFSGRFYSFLQSKACPLKQTIFREWHDERLVPWVHYVPISVGMEELPETVRYLALTTEGSKVAKEVAGRGREWHDKVLRREDAAIYLYRLFLEYARVSGEGRDETRV